MSIADWRDEPIAKEHNRRRESWRAAHWKVMIFDMPPTRSTSRSISIPDSAGRPMELTESQIRERNRVALAALVAIEQIGDAAEHRETLEFLKRAVDDDQLSSRRRFSP